MADEDPLAQIRRSISTTKSRVSSKPRDATEETFMGASIGAKPEPLIEAVDPAAAAALATPAPRRRQKKAARAGATLEVDPAALAQFASSAAADAVIQEEEPEAPKGTMNLDDSPTPTPSPALPAADPPDAPAPAEIAEPTEQADEPAAATPPPAMPEDPTDTASAQEAPEPPAPSAAEPGESTMDELQQELAAARHQLLAANATLSDYHAITAHCQPAADPTPETLAIFLQDRIDRADECDRLEQENSQLLQELQQARHAVAASQADAPATAEVDLLRQQLAELQDDRDRLAKEARDLQTVLAGKEAELAKVLAAGGAAPSITVASLDELDEEMRCKFKETEDFLKEMEEFLKEHAGDMALTGKEEASL